MSPIRNTTIDPQQTAGDVATTYVYSRVWRALGATIAGVSLLAGLACAGLVLFFVLSTPHGNENSPPLDQAGSIIGVEMLVLIGFAALAWGVPAGLALFRWRITVSDGGIVFRAPFSTRVLARTELIAAWRRRWRIGPKRLRIERADGGRGVIFLPSSLVDPRLRRWADDTVALSGQAADSLATGSLTDVSVVNPDGSAQVAAISVAPPAEDPEAIARQYAIELAARIKSSTVTPVIVGINILLFVITFAMAQGEAITPAVVMKLGANAGVYTLRGDWWRLWTSTFIHFGFFHVAVNMLALWQSGRLAEALYGRVRFVLIYLAAGGLGSLASALVHAQTVSAGASGAIFGVYGALLVFSMHTGGSVSKDVFKRIRRSAIFFCAFNLINGFTQAGIDNAAHLGGLAAGLITGGLFYRPVSDSGPLNESWARPAVIAIAALYLILSLPLITASVFPPHPTDSLASKTPQDSSTPVPPGRASANAPDQPLAIAPESKDAVALNSIAVRFRKGLDAPMNPAEAIKWYSKAAALGNAEAQYNLGDMYERGEGIPKNMTAALDWYTKAADQGESLSQDRLGHIYDSGLGVPRNSAEAIEWYTRAAEQGELVDQYALGEIYSQGVDVPKNIAEARKWYQKAADQGFGAASYRLKAMNQNAHHAAQ